eukprot:CAMPEP_0113598232 /NCGR_PEP_ID=MMETSP0015_2-20120614/41460_1 /TAXON_ID=2838 /ORGANISM="Odontella" /LENGTH=174 /DNA_ID=CAMNT_0000506201 /DNA_START=149 /DNA_END=670 /DNA_ORIENTATION=+ /assembly_acc=CAM_ASM_000160
MAEDARDVGGIRSEERLVRGSAAGVDSFGREANPYGSYEEGLHRHQNRHQSSGGAHVHRSSVAQTTADDSRLHGAHGGGGPSHASVTSSRVSVPSPADRNLPVLERGGDDGASYGASSRGWGPGAADTYVGGGSYASGFQSSARVFRQEHVNQLVDQGFSTGLARALAQNAMTF